MILTTAQRAQVTQLVGQYKSTMSRFENIRVVLVDDLAAWKPLGSLLHSMKSRVKEPAHLREKILRKKEDYFTRRGRFLLDIDTLPFRVNDLVGVRLIHLYTRQFEEIDEALRDCLHENNYVIREGPIARVWDSEQTAYYNSIGVETTPSPNLYSSVHYVISTRDDDTGATAELQVRTLADELWGEVNHLLNYPKKSKSVICREQIAVLARLTSGASRLTDSIFLTKADYDNR